MVEIEDYILGIPQVPMARIEAEMGHNTKYEPAGYEDDPDISKLEDPYFHFNLSYHQLDELAYQIVSAPDGDTRQQRLGELSDVWAGWWKATEGLRSAADSC